VAVLLKKAYYQLIHH